MLGNWELRSGKLCKIVSAFQGRCSISSTVVRTATTTGQVQDVWKVLEGVDRGSIKVEVAWGALKVAKPPSPPPPTLEGDDGGYHQGVLTVLVDSCANLLGGRAGGGVRAPDASVRLELCGIAQVTDAVASSASPVFAHRMSFLARDPASDTLKLTVACERTGEQLGWLRVDLSDLLLRPGELALTNRQYALMPPTTRGGRRRRIDGDRQPCAFLSLCFR